MTEEFVDFLDAYDKYRAIKRERDKAFKSCDHSWGYYGYEKEKELEKAGEQLEAAFNAHIAKVILMETP